MIRHHMLRFTSRILRINLCFVFLILSSENILRRCVKSSKHPFSVIRKNHFLQFADIFQHNSTGKAHGRYKNRPVMSRSTIPIKNKKPAK
ncbi:hypothetical protein ACFX13_020841 [Malus domestica]